MCEEREGSLTYDVTFGTHRKKIKIPTLGEDGTIVGLLLGHHWIMKMKYQLGKMLYIPILVV